MAGWQQYVYGIGATPLPQPESHERRLQQASLHPLQLLLQGGASAAPPAEGGALRKGQGLCRGGGQIS